MKTKYKARILTIDDESFIRNNFKAFLEDFGYEVYTAENGKVGLEVFWEKRPDLVLVDLRMPKVDGLDVLRHVNRESENTPIIVVSGTGVLTDAIEAVRLGAWDYLLKPVEDLDLLLHAVEKALDKANLIKENKRYQEELEQMVDFRTEELRNAIKQLENQIANREKAENELKTSQQMLNSILVSVPDIIYRLTPDGKISFLSDPVRYSVYEPEDMIGKEIIEFIHPEDRDKAKFRINERRTGDRRTKNLEIRLMTPETGKTADFEIRYVHRYEENVFLVECEGLYEGKDKGGANFLGSQGIARDISERKIAEEKIKQSLEEKEILLKEIHHRVKNNMQVISSLLNLQIRQTEDEQTRAILMDSKNRVHSMAMVHETVYNSEAFSQINVKVYIQKIVRNLVQSYIVNTDTISVDFDLEDLFISLDSSIPLGLVLNEMISNSLKHAFPDNQPGKIKITLKKISSEKAKLIIEDNGIGIADDDVKDKNTLGLRLIHTLVKQLQGELNFKNDHGSCYELVFYSQINASTLKKV